MLITVSTNARVLRWSMMADEADTARVRNALSNLLQDFVEFRAPGTGYVAFAQHLGLQV